MARSRHGRTGGGSSPAGSGLPSWAQRHLDEAGEPEFEAAPTAPRRPRRAAAEPKGLRGWGVAIVSVAAAVGAVPLAITSLAHDHSDDPLPRVDTYPAGSPGPLQAGGGPGRGQGTAPRTAVVPGNDPSTAGVLDGPPEVAAGPVVPPQAIAAPVPAAVVRATPRVLPSTTTKPATPRSATSTAPTTTTEGRSASKPPSTTPSKPSTGSSGGHSSGGSSHDNGSGSSGGLISNTVKGAADTVSGLTGSLGL